MQRNPARLGSLRDWTGGSGYIERGPVRQGYRVRALFYGAAACVLACVCLSAQTAQADEAKAVVEGVKDSRLRAAITAAIGGTEKTAGSRFEARRRARSAAEEAIAVLRSEGYYQYSVEPDITEGDAPQAVVRIIPGPRFTFAEPVLTWAGPPPVPTARIAGESSLGLTIGAPGRAADVLAAEGRILAAIQKRGYADAEPAPREVIVDHANLSVAPTFKVDAKARVIMDGIDLRTDGRTSRRWVSGLAPWKGGMIYDPEDVGERERRLLDTGAYDSVTVSLAPEPNGQGLRPVVVSLTDRPRATVELGASYSTTEGPGVDGRYTRYNRLGLADTWRIQGQYALIQKRLETELSLPHWGRPAQTLRLGASIYKDDTDAYEETGAQVRADIVRRIGKVDFRTLGVTFGVSRDNERIEINRVLSTRRRRLVTLAGLASMSVDRSNDPLNPVRGWRFEARLEPIAHTGDDRLIYLRTMTQGSVYVPFDEHAHTVAAARLKLGAIVGGRIPEVPGSGRFFAGGGGSVRGYSYQGVGSRYADNTPQGGLSLIETSFELRQRVFDRWTAVAFVDAGILGERAAFDFTDPAVGVGVGVRYDLGFAPIRADIAIPVSKQPGDAAFQIYLSIGQSF